MRRRRARVAGAILLAAAILAPAHARAQTTRVVIFKADGLPQDVIDEMVREKNPRTGQSVLPWIERIFYAGGTRLSNFYVRGLSLSGPSWSMLDTGQHLYIKGNVEYDRYTQHGYDYLNFLPFWLGTGMGNVIDMWGSSVLDGIGIPLLFDAYGHDERYQSFQLFQRGARWTTLSTGAQKRFTTRTPRQLVDEWLVGYDLRGLMTEQFEREVIAGLDDPRVRYLDYYTTEFDHAAHNNGDRASHRFALQELDATIGRIWTAISRTAQAAETALVLVSDHGTNSDEHVISQGFNLVHLLSGASGGGHHVVTKRRLLVDYSIKGIYPFVPLVTTTSSESRYLKGQSDDYPTALLDFDGNERAAFHLRDSTLGELHILLGQLQRRDLPPALRAAAIDAFLAIVDRHRDEWRQTVLEMRNEVAALRRAADGLKATLPPPPDRKSKKEPAQVESPEAHDARLRQGAQIDVLTREATEYGAYLSTVERLLTATKADFANPKAIRIEEFIAKHAMGDRNTLFELQHYVVGPGPSGLVLAADGSLDLDKSFERIDYLKLLNEARVRNNVQPAVSNAPVDFTVIRLPCGAIGSEINLDGADACVWLSSSADAQALVLGRTDPVRGLLLRYVPVARVASDARGVIRATPIAWGSGLPLRLWEEERLDLPAGVTRRDWLDGWHTDTEWLHATHRGMYSNGLVGVHEQFVPHEIPVKGDTSGEPLGDEQLMWRFHVRQRALVEPDVAVVASNHWNFDVRGFNPGGNHGSFLRVSTHATLMFAGGERTGIPRGLSVEEPYDTLSFVPTVFALTGQVDREGRPAEALRERGFTTFPGRVIREVLEAPQGQKPAAASETSAPGP